MMRWKVNLKKVSFGVSESLLVNIERDKEIVRLGMIMDKVSIESYNIYLHTCVLKTILLPGFIFMRVIILNPKPKTLNINPKP